ncbi:hypothetical protein O7627_03270 [Solwaraspora sp. WMMD1047]|uniref:hypothetical protein n=1 Tax=Solwaraspora sp. WMMD1047 TaxID=3016102 RepID=UPI002416B585|nr:hypothetical protein [Solwaraspora sp. WMMD1047]MDG4828324.1 hypothetical protein [Solwaraspora sp. WMMD1047]
MPGDEHPAGPTAIRADGLARVGPGSTAGSAGGNRDDLGALMSGNIPATEQAAVGESGVPECEIVILTDRLRTGLGVGGAENGREDRYLYGEFQGSDFRAGVPSAATLLFTGPALTATILHLMRGGVDVFGPAWARLMSEAFVDSMSMPEGTDGSCPGDLPIGQYL